MTLRSALRSRRGALVLHQLPADGAEHASIGRQPARIGLVVSRAVGNSVHRHRVSRRLRAQVALRLDRFAAGSATVVRALPDAASASSAQLGADLEAALDAVSSRHRGRVR